MRIIDLYEANEPLYLVCLEDWSDEMREAGDHKAQWYSRMKHEGLRVKLAVSDVDTVGGMIQYGPIEKSFAESENLYVIYCIWVHGHKQGRGDFRRRGMGTALLRAAALEEFSGVVEFREIDTSPRDKLLEWGIGDALFIDGKEMRNGPPPSYGKVVKRIRKRVLKPH